MNWISYIFPQTIVKLTSHFNKEIRINEEYGKHKLLVNGSNQSGEYIGMLWEKAFKKFGLLQSHFQGDPLQILILGVGGGSVIKILRSYFPSTHITAVDIDPTMIEISQTYFGLDKVSGLSLVCADAQKYVVKARKSRITYDLILVDIFIGAYIPDFVSDDKFLHLLKSLLSQNGRIVINYLREFEYGKKSDDLLGKLVKIFPVVAEISLYNNRFFRVSMVK